MCHSDRVAVCDCEGSIKDCLCDCDCQWLRSVEMIAKASNIERGPGVVVIEIPWAIQVTHVTHKLGMRTAILLAVNVLLKDENFESFAL